MSGFKSNSFNANSYRNLRPSYPQELFDKLFNHHKGGSSLAVDIGCGTGQASYKLLDKFDEVIGTDISPLMVEEANNSITENHKGRINFKVSPAEQLSFLKDNSVDLITAAECLHYFNHPVFFKEIHRVLKPNGTLAYWSYGFVKLVGYNTDELFEKYVFGEDTLGPYWTYPGITLLRTLLSGIDPPSDLFKDTIRVEYWVHEEDKTNPEAITIKQQFQNPEEFKSFIKTWSGYANWKTKYPEKLDILDQYVKVLGETNGWNKDTALNGAYDFVYVFSTNT